MTSTELSKEENDLSRRAFFKVGSAFLGTALLPVSFSRGSAQGNPARDLQVSDLAFASAREAARAIRRRDVSSLELTELVLSRIEKYNAKVNAIVVPLFEQARARAREADNALARGRTWGPLHGVPVTVKESYDVAGVASTWGNPEFADNVPQVDATVVARLREAGAILLGKTNVPFMLSDWQSFNDVYGVTRNPWDLDRTTGGSTGGGAAALAAGLSYLSVGGDLGGSIRVPAHFCGVFGHKPSRNVVPGKGHAPPLPPVVLPDLEVKGPLARSAADLKLALEILGGPDEEEAAAYRWTLPSARGERLADYRIGYVLDHPHAAVSSGVKAVLSEAVDSLRKAGARLEEGWPEGADPVKHCDTYLYLLEMWIPWDVDGDGVGTWEASHTEPVVEQGRVLAALRIRRGPGVKGTLLALIPAALEPLGRLDPLHRDDVLGQARLVLPNPLRDPGVAGQAAQDGEGAGREQEEGQQEPVLAAGVGDQHEDHAQSDEHAAEGPEVVEALVEPPVGIVDQGLLPGYDRLHVRSGPVAHGQQVIPRRDLDGACLRRPLRLRRPCTQGRDTESS